MDVFFRPEFVLSQSHIRGDHKCSQTTIPDNGVRTVVAKRQVHSRHCSQNKYIHLEYTSFWSWLFYFNVNKIRSVTHLPTQTIQLNTLIICCASVKSLSARFAKIFFISYI